MKITSVECFIGSGPKSFITVKVNTDEGISGFGEAGLAFGRCAEAGFGQCQDFSRLVIGKDPFNTEEIWECLHRHTFWGMGGGVTVNSAIAAIDTACWDIKGKALNVPVYKLLGGKCRPSLRAYASQLQFGWRNVIEETGRLSMLYDPQEYYDVVKEAVADGYDAVKINPMFAPSKKGLAVAEVFATQGTHIRGAFKHSDLCCAVDRMTAAREAAGPDVDIILEVHSLLDANTACELGRAMEPLRIMYYEEPTSPCNPALYNHIKQKCNIPLATGERSYTRWGFRQFFEDRTLSVVQPDLANTGGITETKKICDMAQVYDMSVQIHVCGGPLATAASLHVETAIPNFVIHEEHNANMLDSYKRAAKYQYAPENGAHQVSDLPGLGQEMSEEYMVTARKVVIE